MKEKSSGVLVEKFHQQKLASQNKMQSLKDPRLCFTSATNFTREF